MCMEDVRLGRKKYSRMTQYLCDGAGNAIIPSSDDRTGVRISASGATAIFISDKPAPTAATGFLAVPANALIPFHATVEDDGNLVMQEIHLFAAAALLIPVIETFLDQK